MIATQVVTVTTDSSGDATVYSPQKIRGDIYGVRYVKTDYENTVDFTITGEDSGEGVWTELNVTANKTTRPMVDLQDQAGVDAATPTERRRVALFGERMKIVVANGGDTTSGTFYIYHEAFSA